MPTKSSTTHAAWNYHVHTCCCVNVHMSSVRSGITCSVYIPNQIRTCPKTLAIILQIWCSRFDPIFITRELCFGPQARPKFVTHLIKSWIRFWKNTCWSPLCGPRYAKINRNWSQNQLKRAMITERPLIDIYVLICFLHWSWNTRPPNRVPEEHIKVPRSLQETF